MKGGVSERRREVFCAWIPKRRGYVLLGFVVREVLRLNIDVSFDDEKARRESAYQL